MTSFAATWPLLLTLIKSVALLVVLLIFIAYVLYADRKIWAAVQLRRGPNVVGPFGIWQSFADMLKFVFKEPVIPDGANKGVFLLAPFVMGMLALSAWAVIPISMSAFSIYSRSPRSASMASSWAVGHRTRNIRFFRRCARRRK
jgi:NADH-quinone oxidoreductase subunit H